MDIYVKIKGIKDAGGNSSEGVKVSLGEGACVRDLLKALEESFGEKFTELVYAEGSRELKKNRRFLLNGRDIVFLDGMETSLRDGDRFAVITQMSGGQKIRVNVFCLET